MFSPFWSPHGWQSISQWGHLPLKAGRHSRSSWVVGHKVHSRLKNHQYVKLFVLTRKFKPWHQTYLSKCTHRSSIQSLSLLWTCIWKLIVNKHKLIWIAQIHTFVRMSYVFFIPLMGSFVHHKQSESVSGFTEWRSSEIYCHRLNLVQILNTVDDLNISNTRLTPVTRNYFWQLMLM